jgi:phosphonate transport system substrate-binding protein
VREAAAVPLSRLAMRLARAEGPARAEGAAAGAAATHRTLRAALLTVLLVSVVPSPVAGAESPSDERPLRVAITPVLVERNVELNQRLVAYVAEKMKRPMTIVHRKSYQEVNELIKQKKVDVAFVCSLPYILGKEGAGMELLAVAQRNGRPEYHSYLIVPRDSAARSLDDLRGGLYAYPDPLSNSGYLYPRHRLMQAGFSPERFFRKWIRSHSHSGSIEAVSDGFVDGASVDSYVYDLLAVLRPELTGKTRILEISPPFAFPPVVVRADLPPDTKRRLRHLFLTIHEDPIGAAILRDLLLDGFVNPDDSLFDSIRSMYAKQQEFRARAGGKE